MNQIKAIETRYAGHRFRSRLEARWTVAFDTLGVRWEYEPQGVLVSNRLNILGLPAEWPYLPDFWLPDHNLWCEVKGSLSPIETDRLLAAAAHLSSNGGGGCHDNGGHDLVLLGPIPRPSRRSSWPIRLHMHKGDLHASGWALGSFPQDPHGWDCVVGSDSGETWYQKGPLLTDGWPEKIDASIQAAYTAARSARFEHGEAP